MADNSTILDNLNLSTLGNLISAGTIIGTIIGALPWIAACLGGAYYALTIYENKTVQLYLKTKRLRKIATMKKRIARLEALEKAHKLYDKD